MVKTLTDTLFPPLEEMMSYPFVLPWSAVVAELFQHFGGILFFPFTPRQCFETLSALVSNLCTRPASLLVRT